MDEEKRREEKRKKNGCGEGVSLGLNLPCWLCMGNSC
jgi:hypothetical protein